MVPVKQGTKTLFKPLVSICNFAYKQSYLNFQTHQLQL